jgi:hypothetical protein
MEVAGRPRERRPFGFAGLKKLEEIEYGSLNGKTERGYEWVAALFSKGGERSRPSRFRVAGR